jgi:hypothetical protein
MGLYYQPPLTPMGAAQPLTPRKLTPPSGLGLGPPAPSRALVDKSLVAATATEIYRLRADSSASADSNMERSD